MSDTYRHWSYYRQCLGKRGTKIDRVLRSVIGVYSSHPTAPLSLAARLNTFSEQIFHKLDEQRLALRLPAMRLSAFMLPTETAHLVFAATIPPASDPFWEKRYSQKGRAIAKQDYQKWKGEILSLAERPLTVKELKEASDVPHAILKLVLNRMSFEGLLLRIGAGSLRSNIIRYVSTEAWAKSRFDTAKADHALAWLAGEYLRAFGPVRVKDFQWWTGLNVAKARQAFGQNKTIEVAQDYFLRAGDAEDFESFQPDVKDTVDLLPQWDCYTMGYAPDGRERFVSPDLQDQIYGSLGATGGNALGTVLVNGLAHGSWSSRFQGNKMVVTLKMFEKPAAKLGKAIRQEFHEIAALLGAKSLVFEGEE